MDDDGVDAVECGILRHGNSVGVVKEAAMQAKSEVLAVIEVLKKRFNSLNAVELVALAYEILEAIDNAKK